MEKLKSEQISMWMDNLVVWQLKTSTTKVHMQKLIGKDIQSHKQLHEIEDQMVA